MLQLALSPYAKNIFYNFSCGVRRRAGLGMFKKYSAMTMEERDTIVNEWAHTVLHTTA